MQLPRRAASGGGTERTFLQEAAIQQLGDALSHDSPAQSRGVDDLRARAVAMPAHVIQDGKQGLELLVRYRARLTITVRLPEQC